MKPSNKKKSGKADPRFHKIVNHIVQKNSPSSDPNLMAVEDEADAEDQEGKKKKLLPNSPNDKNFD